MWSLKFWIYKTEDKDNIDLIGLLQNKIIMKCSSNSTQ